MACLKKSFGRVGLPGGSGGITGSVSGVVLLLSTSENLFASVAPWLILAAVGLFTLQPLVVAKVRRPSPATERGGNMSSVDMGDKPAIGENHQGESALGHHHRQRDPQQFAAEKLDPLVANERAGRS